MWPLRRPGICFTIGLPNETNCASRAKWRSTGRSVAFSAHFIILPISLGVCHSTPCCTHHEWPIWVTIHWIMYSIQNVQLCRTRQVDHGSQTGDSLFIWHGYYYHQYRYLVFFNSRGNQNSLSSLQFWKQATLPPRYVLFLPFLLPSLHFLSRTILWTGSLLCVKSGLASDFRTYISIIFIFFCAVMVCFFLPFVVMPYLICIRSWSH